MKKFLLIKVAFIFVLMILILSGCTIGFSAGGATDSGGSANDGGVYKSTNKGTAWEQKVLIQSTGRAKSIAGIEIIALAMDPGDNKAIYAGSFDNGLFYSYDAAESWQVATGLGKVSVSQAAVNPADKCVIYAAAANKVFKSDDCNRNWAQVYFDNDLKVNITALAIDPLNGNNIFIGTSRGEVIKSLDRGISWRVLDRFDSQVDKIIINSVNSKIIFAGTMSKGVYRSTDGGAKWENLDGRLKAFDDNRRFRDLVMAKADKMTVFLATNYGLLKSADDGDTWSKVELITPEKEARINSVAVSPNNTNEIYYVTGTTFYRSLDGGKNWTSKKLPTNRAGSKLLIDPKNSAIIYLAAEKVKK